MGTSKHVWVAALVLAAVAACVLTATPGSAVDATGEPDPDSNLRALGSSMGATYEEDPDVGENNGRVKAKDEGRDSSPPTPPPAPGANVMAFLNAIKGGNALEAEPTFVCIRFFQQFFVGTEVETVPAVGPNDFGRIDTFEVSSTITADPNSLVIAKARGVLFYDNQEFSAYENKWTLTFTSESGLPANSSINFQGFEPNTAIFPEPYTYSVVGGTGAFACARGVVTESVVFVNDFLETDADIACMVVGCGFDPAKAFDLFSNTFT